MKNRKIPAMLALIMAGCCLISFSQNKSAVVQKAETKAKLAHPEVPRMPAKVLVQLLKKKADIIIVDTQSAEGYEMWHIPSSINITYDAMADPAQRQLSMMGLPMDKPIVIYCLCEEGTDSAKMALEFRQLGYRSENVKVLEGGLILWDEKGYSMVKQKIAK